jgi:hypothetical protein
MWYAYVPGVKQGKTRPVIVLKQADKTHWLVIYLTSRAPKSHLEYQFAKIDVGELIGISLDSWGHATDLRALTRGRFRTYVGVCSTPVYDRLCEAGKVKPDPAARTINEVRAGGTSGPGELALHHALGVYRYGDPKGVVDPIGYDMDSTTRAFFRELWRSILEQTPAPATRRGKGDKNG